MTEMLISSSVLIAVLLVLRMFLKGRVKHRIIYGLWLAAAVRLMLPFSLAESSVSVMNLFRDSAPQIYTYETEAVYTEPVYDNISPDIETPPMPDSGEYISPDIIYEEPPEMKTALSLKETALIVWGAGSVLMLLWFGWVNFSFYFKLKCSREKFEHDAPIKIYTADGIKSPCLFGLFRPCIYVTEEAVRDRERLDFIITHELCHYRHGDMIWAAVRNLLTAFYWFDPFVWAAAIASKRDCELACDEAAVAVLGEEKRIAYGKALVDMAAEKRSLSGIALASTSMSAGGGLKERIGFIASKPKYSVTAAVILAAAVLVTAGCTFTSAKDEPPAETNSVQSEAQSEDVPAEEAEVQRQLEEQAEFQRELEERRQEEMLELQEGFVVYEFGMMSGNVPFNIKIKANSGSKADGYIVTGGFTMYAYNNQGELVSSIPISTGATGLNGTEFDLSRAEEYFRFSKGSTIVYSHPVGEGVYLAGMYGFENTNGFYKYNIRSSEQLPKGFPAEIRVSTHEIFIGDNFSFSVDDPGVDNIRFSGSTYFTGHSGKKIIYTAEFNAHRKMAECGYFYCGGESSEGELTAVAAELLARARDEGFITDSVYKSEMEKVSDRALVLYEYDVAAFTVKAVTKDVPDENGFVYGDYYLRTYGKSSGELVSEVPMRSGAVGNDGIAVKADEGEKYFQFSAPYSSFICFGYPLKDSPDDGDLNYLCSLYGFDSEGQLFEYSTDELDIELYHGNNEIKAGSFAASEPVYYHGDDGAREKLLFRTNYSEYENGTLYTTLCGIMLDSETRTAELAYNYRGAYDEEIASAAEKAVFVKEHLLSFSVFTPLEDENTMIEDYGADGGYYQLDTSVAETEEELYSFIADTFTDEGVAGYKDLRHELFGGDPPMFKTIDGKLCYLNIYNGVPVREIGTVPYVTIVSGDSAKVYALCHGIDYYTILECGMEKCPDGRWRAASVTYLDYIGK